MRDSKKYMGLTGRILIFFSVLVLILAGMSYGLKREVATDEKSVQISEKPLEDLKREPAQTINLVVLGNSLSFTSIEPKTMEKDFGYNTWVLGQPGQLIQSAYYSLESTYETQSPKVVLLETAMMFDGPEGTNSLKTSMDMWMRYRMPFIHFHDLWRTYIFGKEYVTISYHGFKERTVVEPYLDGPYMEPTDEEADFKNNSRHYVKKIKDLCDAHGTRLILYSCPSPANYNYKIHNALTRWCGEEEIEYLDLNLMVDEIGIDWNLDALDGGDHLNLDGALKVTDFIGKIL